MPEKTKQKKQQIHKKPITILTIDNNNLYKKNKNKKKNKKNRLRLLYMAALCFLAFFETGWHHDRYLQLLLQCGNIQCYKKICR